MQALKPYIGINGAPRIEVTGSGYANEQVRAVGRQVIMGIQATEKTQIHDIENRYGKDWHPVGNTMRHYWGWYANRMLHINTDNKVPESVATIARIMLERTIVAGWDETEMGSQYPALESKCNKVQFNNLPFHEYDYRQVFKNIVKKSDPISPVYVNSIVLQANAATLDELNPKDFAERVKLYAPYIGAVLLDGSGGKGIPLDANKLRPYIDAIYGMSINVGIAGGLNADTVEPLAGKLLQEYRKLSVDAESGLRTRYNPENPKLSKFSSKKAEEFVEAVTQLLQ